MIECSVCGGLSKYFYSSCAAGAEQKKMLILCSVLLPTNCFQRISIPDLKKYVMLHISRTRAWLT